MKKTPCCSSPTSNFTTNTSRLHLGGPNHQDPTPYAQGSGAAAPGSIQRKNPGENRAEQRSHQNPEFFHQAHDRPHPEPECEEGERLAELQFPERQQKQYLQDYHRKQIWPALDQANGCLPEAVATYDFE